VEKLFHLNFSEGKENFFLEKKNLFYFGCGENSAPKQQENCFRWLGASKVSYFSAEARVH
jgi:hypothetical protein